MTSNRHGITRPNNDFLGMQQQMTDRAMHLQPQQQNYLQQSSHYIQPQQPMIPGMPNQQIPAQYGGIGPSNYQQNAYQLYNLQQNPNLYLQQQQFDHQPQVRIHSNIQMAMPQTQPPGQIHHQHTSSIPPHQAQPLMHQATSATSSIVLPQQPNIQQPSPSNRVPVQQQSSLHSQKAISTPPPSVERTVRHYESATKAAERAAAVSWTTVPRLYAFKALDFKTCFR